MAKGLVNESSLNSIAEAINVLNGTEGTYAPSEMGEAIIDAIPTETASGNPIHITDAAAYPAVSCVTTLEPVQEGSGDPSPENVRPITGHTGVELTRTGKNLANISTGNNVVIGAVKQGQSYTFSCDNTGSVGVNLKKNNSSGGVLATTVNVTSESKIVLTFTPDEDCEAFINGYTSQAGDFATHVSNFQLELGSTATTYEPYRGEAHSTTFPQAQSPVYGAEVDWVNGVLKVTDVKTILDGKNNIVSNGGTSGGGTVYQTEWSAYRSIGVPSAIYISDKFKTVATSDKAPYTIYPASDGVSIRMFLTFPTTITSITDANAWLKENNVEVVYPLATPLEIPLTPEVITLLKGNNNIWTDSGTSEIEYKVDLQSHIQKLIDEASTKSSLSVSPLSLGKSAAVSTDGESEEAEELPVEDVESVDEADEAEEKPTELLVEEDTEEEPTEKEPDTLEKEGGDTV